MKHKQADFFFCTWLPELYSQAKLISSQRELEEAWLHGDLSRSSVVDVGELYEQLLGFSDVEVYVNYVKREFKHDSYLLLFLEQYLEVDRQLTRDSNVSATKLLESEGWKELRRRAKSLIVSE